MLFVLGVLLGVVIGSRLRGLKFSAFAGNLQRRTNELEKEYEKLRLKNIFFENVEVIPTDDGGCILRCGDTDVHFRADGTFRSLNNTTTNR